VSAVLAPRLSMLPMYPADLDEIIEIENRVYPVSLDADQFHRFDRLRLQCLGVSRSPTNWWATMC
jgi:hypothetical protein